MAKDKTPAWVEQAKQDAADQANQEKVNDAYEKSRTSTYSGGGHVHHSEHFKKHAAGHEYEQDKVRKMCGGGMSKGKK
jgi:hypothetical protein